MATSAEGEDRVAAGGRSPWRGAPALAPALLFLLSAGAGRALVVSRPLAAALVAAGLAAAPPVRRYAAAIAFGLLLAAASAPGIPPAAGRPVDLVGRPDGPWRRDAFGWSAWLHPLRYRQGRTVRSWRPAVLVRTGGEAPPPAAHILRVRGYVSRRPGPASPGARRPGPWVLVAPRALVRVEGRERAGAALLRRLRARLDRDLSALGAARPGVALARALALGERDALGAERLAGLRRLGLAHLTALSGLHVALVAALVVLAARPLSSLRMRWLLAIAAVAGYTLVAGARPSLVRAAVMASVAAVCTLAQRRHAPWNALAVAAVALVCSRPSWLADPGLLLSLSATAGLLWGVVSAPGSARGAGLLRAAGASLCAQLAALPWALSLFHVVQPLAPLWNLAAVPWLGAALLVSLALASAAIAWPWAAGPLAAAADRVAAPLGWAACRPPDHFVTLASPGVLWVTLLALLGLWGWGRAPRRTLAGLLGLLLLARCSGLPNDDPELVVLDVGQGSASLLRRGGEAILVDGGGWSTGDVARSVTVPALAALGLDGLRAVVMSHPDLDHCRGLWQLARVVAVAEIWIGTGWGPSPCLRRLLATPGPRLRVLLPGDRLSVAGWRLSVLHPPAGYSAEDNDRSLVLRAEARGRSVLLPGDLQAAGERRLLATAPPGTLRADVLLVPHHGSRSSTGTALLAAVEPRLALLSAGRDNRFGHPHAEVLARLRARGVPFLVTGDSGWIRIRLARDGLRIATPASPPGA